MRLDFSLCKAWSISNLFLLLKCNPSGVKLKAWVFTRNPLPRKMQNPNSYLLTPWACQKLCLALHFVVASLDLSVFLDFCHLGISKSLEGISSLHYQAHVSVLPPVWGPQVLNVFVAPIQFLSSRIAQSPAYILCLAHHFLLNFSNSLPIPLFGKLINLLLFIIN